MSSQTNQATHNESKASSGGAAPGHIPLDTSTGPDLGNLGPTSPKLEKDAARAMESTDAWKPSLGGRKGSYHQQDQKHQLQMSALGGAAGGGRGGGGEGGSRDKEVGSGAAGFSTK